MSNVLYNEYVDQAELESDIALMKESLKIDRLALTYNTLMEQEELSIREAELKCMLESGDMNDLAMYYEEANDETAEKKEGILKRLWEQIKSFFSKLKEFLFGSKQMKKLDQDAANNEEYGVDAEGYETLNKLKKIKASVGNKLEGFFKQDVWKIILEILAAGLVGVAVPLTAHNVKKVKAGEIKGIKDWLKEWADTIQNNTIDKVKDIVAKFGNKNEEGEKVNEISFLTKVKDFFSKAINWIKGIIPFGKKEGDDESTNSSDKSKENNVKKNNEKETNTNENKSKEEVAKESAEDDIFQLDDLFAESSVDDIDSISSLLDLL